MWPDKINIPFQPKQLTLDKLLNDTNGPTIIGYGGSRGGAKSHGARASMLKKRLSWPATGGIIIRKTYEDLWDEHITKFFRDWPFLRDCYNDKHREMKLPNGSFIKFGYAQHDGDMEDQFQGKGFMDVDIDEATKHSEKDLVFCRTFCRWDNVPERACKVLMTMNPGGVSHAYVKRIFIKREYLPTEDSSEYAFIQARAWDNVEWCRSALRSDNLSPKAFYSWTEEKRFKYFIERSSYGKMLNSMPEALRVGHLLGDWDRYSGQYFDVFTEAHVQDLRAVIKPWYPRWLSIDWGFAHNAAIYGHAAMPNEHVHTYGEIVVNRKTPGELAALVAQKFGNERIEAIYLPPDTEQNRAGGDTIAQQLSDAFESYGLPRCSRAANARVPGWTLWYNLMAAALWSCDPSCKVLIETLPSATRDEDKLEDVVKVDVEGGGGTYGDDSWDSVRYGLFSRIDQGQAPLHVRVEERVAHLDYNSRQHAIPRVMREESMASEMVPWAMKRPNRGVYH